MAQVARQDAQHLFCKLFELGTLSCREGPERARQHLSPLGENRLDPASAKACQHQRNGASVLGRPPFHQGRARQAVDETDSTGMRQAQHAAQGVDRQARRMADDAQRRRLVAPLVGLAFGGCLHLVGETDGERTQEIDGSYRRHGPIICGVHVIVNGSYAPSI